MGHIRLIFVVEIVLVLICRKIKALCGCGVHIYIYICTLYIETVLYCTKCICLTMLHIKEMPNFCAMISPELLIKHSSMRQ
jgi:hypothetical protein